MNIREARDSRKPIHSAAHFPGVNNTTVWSDPSGQPDRVRIVRAPGPHRGAGTVRLLLPRRGPAAARAPRPDPRPRRRRQARHLHRARRARRGDRAARPGRHHQHHVQRTLRGGKAIRDAGPPVRRAAGVEHGHLVGRVHRRELPPRGVPRPRRPLQRAEEFITVAPRFWDSWAPEAVVADVDRGVYVDPARIGSVEHDGPQFRRPRRRLAARRAARPSGAAAGR